MGRVAVAVGCSERVPVEEEGRWVAGLLAAEWMVVVVWVVRIACMVWVQRAVNTAGAAMHMHTPMRQVESGRRSCPRVLPLPLSECCFSQVRMGFLHTSIRVRQGKQCCLHHVVCQRGHDAVPHHPIAVLNRCCVPKLVTVGSSVTLHPTSSRVV